MRCNLNIGEWHAGHGHVHASQLHAKLANPAEKYPVPRFRQRIEIRGTSYTILCQQFPMQLVYRLTRAPRSGLHHAKGSRPLGGEFLCLRTSLRRTEQGAITSRPGLVAVPSFRHFPSSVLPPIAPAVRLCRRQSSNTPHRDDRQRPVQCSHSGAPSQ